jgi:hypothetical protein
MQCRVREIMLSDWNENGLETHDDIQVEHRCARTARASKRGCELIALFTRDLWERSGTPGLSIAPASKLDSAQLPDERFALLPVRCAHRARRSR